MYVYIYISVYRMDQNGKVTEISQLFWYDPVALHGHAAVLFGELAESNSYNSMMGLSEWDILALWQTPQFLGYYFFFTWCCEIVDSDPRFEMRNFWWSSWMVNHPIIGENMSGTDLTQWLHRGWCGNYTFVMTKWWDLLFFFCGWLNHQGWSPHDWPLNLTFLCTPNCGICRITWVCWVRQDVQYSPCARCTRTWFPPGKTRGSVQLSCGRSPPLTAYLGQSASWNSCFYLVSTKFPNIWVRILRLGFTGCFSLQSWLGTVYPAKQHLFAAVYMVNRVQCGKPKLNQIAVPT